MFYCNFDIYIYVFLNISSMNHYSNKAFITSENQLRLYLKHCKKCANLTNNGNFIFSHETFSNFKINAHKNNMCFIINNLDPNSNAETTGHWIVMMVHTSSKMVLLFDPRNHNFTSIDSNFKKSLDKFIKINDIRHFKQFDLRTQQKYSRSCGIHCIYMIHFSHNNCKRSFIGLRRIFQHYSVGQREKFIVHNTLSRLFTNK